VLLVNLMMMILLRAGSRNCAACKFDDDDFIEASLVLHTIVLSKEVHLMPVVNGV